MPSSKLFRPLFLAALVSALVGCGYSSPTAYVDPTTGQTMYYDPSTGQTSYVDPTTGQLVSANPYGYATDPSPMPIQTPEVVTGTNTYPSNFGNAAVVAPQLTVGPLDKSTSGILLWKRLTVKGQVKNTTNAYLSGEMQVSFMKSGKVVETQYEFVTDLPPGQSHSFSLVSKKVADDAQASISSQPGNSSSNTAAGGSSTYGSSYSSYGSSYGSSTTGYGY